MLSHLSSCLLFTACISLFIISVLSLDDPNHDSTAQNALQENTPNDPLHYNDPLPRSTRQHWMRLANTAVLHTYHSQCPFMAFGTAIVNHTLSFIDLYPGDLICTGLNHNNHTSNPILDGEIAAIENCSTILTDPNGRFKLSIREAIEAYNDLTIYTNGEPCPMCASAIVWTGFREMVFGTSIATLVKMGWPQIRVDSWTIFEGSWDLRRRKTAWVGSVLSNETDSVFEWQFQEGAQCPKGCERKNKGGRCLDA